MKMKENQFFTKKKRRYSTEKIAEQLLESPRNFSNSQAMKDKEIQVILKCDLTTFLGSLKKVLFPKIYFPLHNRKLHLESSLNGLNETLCGLLEKSMGSQFPDSTSEQIKIQAENCATHFLSSLPEIRELLSSDVEAAKKNDPAAESCLEVVLSYPSIEALVTQRCAHVLLTLGVPLIPRMLTEIAHSRTGIDIHPRAEIGPGFFMDHGTGIVIGETTKIGKNVTIYQGVTLGAMHYPKNKWGEVIKGYNRHPIVEDQVTIYGGATILGPVRIGTGSKIGGNVWVTEDIKPYSFIVQSSHNSEEIKDASFAASDSVSGASQGASPSEENILHS